MPGRRTDLSQHFLRRGALAARLVSSSSITSRDRVLELGAGTGALTGELAKRCGQLWAVEIDPRLCHALECRFHGDRRVRVVRGDLLSFSLPGDGPYKVFANLPFHLTSPALRRLAEAERPPEDAYVIVQREAAQRYAGGPYAPETLLSLRLKPWWQIEILGRIARRDFQPPPSVDCAFLWLARRTRPLVEAREKRLYRDFVSASFGRRGTALRDGLRGLLSPHQIRRLARELRFDPGNPPSALGFEQWLGIYRLFADRAGPAERRRVRGAERRLPRGPKLRGD